MVIFLFEMVFMDTALTIVTGACAERWKFATFAVSSVIMGALTYPLFGNWAWVLDGFPNSDQTRASEKVIAISRGQALFTRSEESPRWPFR